MKYLHSSWPGLPRPSSKSVIARACTLSLLAAPMDGRLKGGHDGSALNAL